MLKRAMCLVHAMTLALLAASAFFMATASCVDAAGDVRYVDGKFWFEIDETPAAEVLSAVSNKTGFVIAAPDSLMVTPVSVRVSGLPVQAAVERVLRSAGYASYVMIYEPHGQLRRLVVLHPNHGEHPLREPKVMRPSIAAVDAIPPRPISAEEPQARAGQATLNRTESLRQQMKGAKTLNAAEQHALRQELQRLPLKQRLESSLRYRRDVLGYPIEDDEAYQPNPLRSSQPSSRARSR